MDWTVIAELGKAWGTPGLLIGFMIWDRIERNKLEAKRSEADLEMAKGITSMGKDFSHLSEIVNRMGK